MTQHGYTAGRAEQAIASIHTSTVVWRMFEEFLASEQPPKSKVAGITYDMLIGTYRLNPVNAWVVWAWLHKEPRVAKRALQSGYDATSL